MSTTNKPVLVILRGLPASGKTTWAIAWVKENRANRVRVNKDDLREMIDDGTYVEGLTENRIIAARDVLVKGLMMRGLSVVVDDTNLSMQHVKKLARIAHQAHWNWSVQDFTNVDLDTCLIRNGDRIRYGDRPLKYPPQDVIRDMHQRYLKGKKLPLPLPTLEQLGEHELGEADMYVPPEGMPGILLIDIDGTLALHGTRSPFDESRVHEDRPNMPVIEAVKADLIVNRVRPVYMSGRTEACYDATWLWLDEYIGTPTDLFMRPVGDTRADCVVKRELFDKHIRHKYQVRRVYDDRNQVVQMWRSLGLTVMQVADGAF